MMNDDALDMIVVVASVPNYRTDGLYATATKREALAMLRRLWRDHWGKTPMPEVTFTKGRFCDLFKESA
jgi:hypothetical protein